MPGAAVHAFDGGFADADEAEQAAGEHEGVAWAEHIRKIFLDLAEGAAAHAAEPDLEDGSFDDGADVHAGLAGGAFAADVDAAFVVPEKLAVALIAGQRVAAVLDEGEHVVEIALGEGGVGGGAADFRQHVGGHEGGGGGGEQQVLGENIQTAGAWRVAVELAGGDPGHGGLALQNLETVGGDEDGVAGFVHAVVGAADALEEAGDAFRGADLDHLVDAAPVDAEVEGGGGDDAAQFAGGHGLLDALALGEVEAAVVESDGEVFFVELPEFLEEQLALGSRVDEDDGHAGGADTVEDDAGRGEAHAAGPGYPLLGEHHAEFGGRAFGYLDQAGGGAGADVGEQGCGVGDGGGEADAAGFRGQGGEAGEAKGELVAALGAGEGVDFVDDDRVEVGKESFGALLGEEDGQALGGRQQDVGRGVALPAAVVGAGVAGAGVDADGQVHLLDRDGQVARDVGGQGFQGTHVEGVEAGGVAGGCQVDQAGEEAG